MGEFGEEGGGAAVEILARFGSGVFVEGGFGFGGGTDEDFLGPGEEVGGAVLDDVAEVQAGGTERAMAWPFAGVMGMSGRSFWVQAPAVTREIPSEGRVSRGEFQ